MILKIFDKSILFYFLAVANLYVVTCFFPAHLMKFKLFRPNVFIYAKENKYLKFSEQSLKSLDDIKDEIGRYLSYREQANLPPLVIEDKKNDDFISGMLKPTGWYKDEQALDLKRRSNSRAPIAFHPLSYLELQRHGFEHLVEGVMKFGGPYVVGNLLGIPWVEPERPKLDTNGTVSSKREENFAFDFQGSLVLGSALEDRLSLAAEIDVEDLKRNIEQQQQMNTNSIDDDDVDSFGEDYLSTRRNVKSKLMSSNVADINSTNKDKFIFGIRQRAFLVLTCMSLSLAYGRASQDIISNHIWGDIDNVIFPGSYVVSTALIASAIASSIQSFKIAKFEKNRNSFLWSLSGLLGGPFSVYALKDLQPLNNNTTTTVNSSTAL